MFNLNKLAYIQCSDEEKKFYDDLPTPEIDVKPCCLALVGYIKRGYRITCDDISYDQYFNKRPAVRCWSEEAAYNGHLECLQFAMVQGFPRSKDICVQAVIGGQLSCLQYAVEQGCPWHSDVCAAAASFGRLEELRFARDNGCPWDCRAYECAQWNSRIEVCQYIEDNRD